MTLWDRIKSILGRLLPVPFLGAVMLLCVFLSSCAGLVPMNSAATTNINQIAGVAKTPTTSPANDLAAIATGVNTAFTTASYFPTQSVLVTQGMLLPDLEQAAVITYSFTIDGSDGPWTPAEQAQALVIARTIAINIQAQVNVLPAAEPVVAAAKKVKLSTSNNAILQGLIALIPANQQAAFSAWLTTSGQGLLQISIADAEASVAYWLKGNVFAADQIVYTGLTKAQRLQAGLTFLQGTQIPDTNKAMQTTQFERTVATGGLSMLLQAVAAYLGL